MKPSVTATVRPAGDAYAGLADLNIIGVLFWDADGHITGANDRFLQTVRYSREDLVAGALHVSEITPGEWRAADAEALEALAARGACTPYEKEYVRKDGTRVPVLLSALRLDQSQDHGVAFVVDLSERRHTEQAGESADRERQRLGAFSRDVGVAFAQSGTLASMLQLCAELMVTHLEAAAARIWTPNIREDGFQLLAGAGCVSSADGPDAVTGTLFDVGTIVRERIILTSSVSGDPRFDQTWAAANRVVSFVGYPLIVSERVVGVITMFGRAPFSDPTVQAISYIAHAVASAIERERSEASQARLAAIVEATTDMVSISILEGRVFNLSYINQAGRAMLGIGPQESVADLSAFRTAESLTELNDVILPAVLRDGLWSGETTYVSRDGRLVPVSQLAFTQTNHGQVQFCNIARDITDRKRIEAQLRQSQKMDAIGQLAGGVAHDFNNLLTVILGYAEFIAGETGYSEQHQRDVREIIRAADRAVGLTTQLLAFSRKQVLQSTFVDVNALVAETSEMLGRLIGEHIELVTVLAPDLGTVFADQGQLQQVLMNLAVNARDAMSHGGRLVIETADVQLDRLSGLYDQEVVPGRYVMLAVTDSGTGMDAETRGRLFEPFFSTKDRGKGTGLGLATVYGIVKQSEGYISVASQPGQGATFKVYLPRSSAGAQPDVPAAVVDLPRRGAETVLLVEDEDGVRRLAQRILESAGYHVLAAANAVEATELFARHRDDVDLVITDVVMPGTSGPTLIQQLTILRPGLKVLYMSGYNEDAIVRQARLDRGLPFVQKPFTAAVLARTVREALS